MIIFWPPTDWEGCGAFISVGLFHYRYINFKRILGLNMRNIDKKSLRNKNFIFLWTFTWWWYQSKKWKWAKNWVFVFCVKSAPYGEFFSRGGRARRFFSTQKYFQNPKIIFDPKIPFNKNLFLIKYINWHKRILWPNIFDPINERFRNFQNYFCLILCLS